MADPILDGFRDDPPKPAVDRTIYVGTGGTNTIRLMHEPHDFTTRFLENSPARRGGNAVRYLLGGVETFKQMVDEIRSCTGPGHYIYLTGWQLQTDLALVAGDASTTILELFKAADAKGVQIRTMLWRNIVMSKNGSAGTFFAGTGFQFTVPPSIYGQIFDKVNPWNLDETNQINALPGDSGGIVDSRISVVGSHHQKALVVNGSKGLVAFLGGIDIVANRMSQLYDVHCKVRGPAAHDVLATFIERWNDHPDHTAVEAKPGRKALVGAKTPLPGASGTTTAQVTRTYPVARLQGGPVFSFAPTGKIEVWLQLKAAIARAQRYIYMENQYFVSVDLARLLAAQLPSIKHLTILIQSWSDMRGGLARTQRCLDILRKAPGGADKVRVFAHTSQYVHTKTWIIDDEVAIIGSDNSSRRSYTCDTEICAGFTDSSNETKPGWRFARRLRARLWGHLLGMETADGFTELADGIASAVHWLDPPAGAKITPFDAQVKLIAAGNPNDPYLDKTSDTVWDNVIDPFTGQIGP